MAPLGRNQAQVIQNYTYDAIGNILDKAGVRYEYCNHPLQPAPAQNCTGTLHPSAVVRTVDQATSIVKTYTYDTNGNTLGGAGRSFVWDFDSRVDTLSASGGTLVMDYDYTGIRLKKTTSSGTTLYPFSGYEIAPDGVTITKYIRIGLETIAAKKSTPTTTKFF